MENNKLTYSGIPGNRYSFVPKSVSGKHLQFISCIRILTKNSSFKLELTYYIPIKKIHTETSEIFKKPRRKQRQ